MSPTPRGTFCLVEVDAVTRVTVVALHPPTAIDDAFEVVAGGTLALDPAQGVLANDEDTAGDALRAVLDDASGAHGSVVLGASGDLTYQPDPAFVGTAAFTYHAVDAHGSASAPARVELTVRHVNRRPVAQDGSATTTEDEKVALDLQAEDPDGDPLTFLVTKTEHGRAKGDGPRVTFEPDHGFHGRASLTFTASDGELTSEPATVTIDVAPKNHPPVASDLDLTMADWGATEIVLSGTDPDGDSITFQVTSEPKHGQLFGSPPRLYYVPDHDRHDDAFTYTASDGTLASHPATVTLRAADGGRRTAVGGF